MHQASGESSFLEHRDGHLPRAEVVEVKSGRDRGYFESRGQRNHAPDPHGIEQQVDAGRQNHHQAPAPEVRGHREAGENAAPGDGPDRRRVVGMVENRR